MYILRKFAWKYLGGVFLVVGLLAGVVELACAASSAVTHSVTAVVPTVLSLTTSTGALAFTFPDYLSGTDSDVQTGSYTVKANNMTTTGRVEGALSAAIAGMNFKGDPQAYSSTSGSVSFVESYSGFSTIAATAVKMYDQSGASGSAQTARGTFTVNYKFTSTTDLNAGSYGPVTLTVTLFNT